MRGSPGWRLAQCLSGRFKTEVPYRYKSWVSRRSALLRVCLSLFFRFFFLKIYSRWREWTVRICANGTILTSANGLARSSVGFSPSRVVHGFELRRCPSPSGVSRGRCNFDEPALRFQFLDRSIENIFASICKRISQLITIAIKHSRFERDGARVRVNAVFGGCHVAMRETLICADSMGPVIHDPIIHGLYYSAMMNIILLTSPDRFAILGMGGLPSHGR